MVPTFSYRKMQDQLPPRCTSLFSNSSTPKIIDRWQDEEQFGQGVVYEDSFSVEKILPSPVVSGVSTSADDSRSEKIGRCDVKESISFVSRPHPHDVLVGRGNFCKHHEGNEHFRSLVNLHKVMYVAAPKGDKPRFANMIVDMIAKRDPPGRFLQQDPRTPLWFEVGHKKAMMKTRQALREGAPKLKAVLTQNPRLKGDWHLKPRVCSPTWDAPQDGHIHVSSSSSGNFTSPTGIGQDPAGDSICISPIKLHLEESHVDQHLQILDHLQFEI